MNLFEKAKLKKEKYLCIRCGKVFEPDKRNLKRGWGLYCSKKCSINHIHELRVMTKDDYKIELRNKRLAQLGIR